MVRCDMCDAEGYLFHTTAEGRKLTLCNACSQLMEVTKELQKLNTFWLEKYTELHETVTKIAHGMSVAIGVRNTKINELKGKIEELRKIQNITSGEQGVELGKIAARLNNTNEIYLARAVERIATLEKQLKKLTEQVDLNSQTLEALQ